MSEVAHKIWLNYRLQHLLHQTSSINYVNWVCVISIYHTFVEEGKG